MLEFVSRCFPYGPLPLTAQKNWRRGALPLGSVATKVLGMAFAVGNDFAFKVVGGVHPRLSTGYGNVAFLGKEPGHPTAAAHQIGISLNHAGTVAARGGLL